MQSHARQMTIYRWLPLLDGRLAQGGVIIGAFATAAVLAALYGPGPRAATDFRQSVLPVTTMTANAAPVAAEPAKTAAPAANSGAQIDEEAARQNALRKLAAALTRQAAEAAGKPTQAAAAEPAPPAAQAAPVAPPVAKAAPATPPPASTALSAEDLQKLANKAAQAIRSGDIAGARLVLEHAVAGGDTTAIYALAETYDPRVLAQLHVRGLQGDADKARSLYEQARANGVAGAQDAFNPAGE